MALAWPVITLCYHWRARCLIYEESKEKFYTRGNGYQSSSKQPITCCGIAYRCTARSLSFCKFVLYPNTGRSGHRVKSAHEAEYSDLMGLEITEITKDFGRPCHFEDVTSILDTSDVWRPRPIDFQPMECQWVVAPPSETVTWLTVCCHRSRDPEIPSIDTGDGEF